MSWETIVADPEFQALESDRKQKIANNYFAKNFESDEDFISLPEAKRFKIRSNFESTLNLERPSLIPQPIPVPTPTPTSTGLQLDDETSTTGLEESKPSEITKALKRGVVNVGRQTGLGLEYLAEELKQNKSTFPFEEELEKQFPAPRFMPENIPEKLESLGKKMAKSSEEYLKSRPDLAIDPELEKKPWYEPKRLAVKSVEAAPLTVAGMVAGTVAGLVTKNPFIAAGISSTMFGLTSAGEIFKEAKEAGMEPEKALTPARLGGLGEGVLEFVPGYMFMRLLKIGKPLSKTVLTEGVKELSRISQIAKGMGQIGLAEGIEEGLQTTKDNLIAGNYYEPERPLLKDVPESVALGGIMGVGLGGAGSVAGQVIERTPTIGLKIEEPDKREVSKFEPEPEIRTKGQGLKFEEPTIVSIEKPLIKPQEETILVKGEKPIIPEQPISKPIVEPTIKEEIPTTLTSKVKPRGIIPTKEIWDKTPSDVQNEWSDVIDYLEESRHELEKQIKPLKAELASLKGRGNKERKEELRNQIDELTEIYKEAEGEYEQKSYDTSTELRNEAIGKAKQSGLVDEDTLEAFADDFLLESSSERPYIEVNYQKTTQQIFDEVLDRYLATQQPKEVIASEETEGQETQESLPLEGQGTSPDIQELPTGEVAPGISKILKETEDAGRIPEGRDVEEVGTGKSKQDLELKAQREGVSGKGTIEQVKPISNAIINKRLKLIDSELINRAKAKAQSENNDYMNTIINGIQVGKKGITTAERTLLNDYLGYGEDTTATVSKGGKVEIQPSGEAPTAPAQIQPTTVKSPIGATIKFIRYGKPIDNSTDYITNTMLKGMSVYEINETGASKGTIRSEFADRKDVYIGTGKIVGYGSDGEPLVSDYKIRKANKIEDEKAVYGGISRGQWLKEHGYNEKGEKIQAKIQPTEVIEKTSPVIKQAESFTSDEAMINSYGEKELKVIVAGDYRTRLKELAQLRLDKITEETKPIAKSNIGTLDKIDTIALSDVFKSEIDKNTPLNKITVKKIVAGKLGLSVGGLIPEKGYKHKAIEEAYEYAIVKKGREIAQSDISLDKKFEATKEIYSKQLNLSERTSTSIEKQQYSTPLPLAMAINQYLGIDKNTSVYEPTAGNGMLLIGANPKKTVANELATDYRQAHLKDTGFSAIQGDAMKFIKDTGMEKSFDTVVMNPPFGNAEIKLFDNYRIRKLEHQIALESLKAMKDNGNAAIIIGGHNFEQGKMIESDRIFLNYLYSHFNVTHNIDINGDVYRRMGTSFPIRLLTIEGRKATPDTSFAPTEQSQVESANTFDDVNNILQKPIQKRMEVKHEDIGKESIADRLSGKESTRVEGLGEGRQKGNEPTGSVRDIVPGTGISDTGVVEQPGRSESITGGIVGKKGEQQGSRATTEVAGSEGVRPEELPGRVPPKQPRLASGNIQDPYIPQSKGNSGKNLIPKNLVEPIAKVLQKIENTYGDVDTFVQQELGYKTKEELFKSLSAEQIDAVSVIISNIKDGKSIILGDQTGVGKGRVVAATIRYANNQGIKPIFFTEKPNLFSDIHRDLVDINHKVNPFILHSDISAAVLDKEGKKVFSQSFVGESKNKMIQNPTKTIEDYDMLMTTYSQVNKENKQRNILKELAQNNIIILDESHNAAGASNTGQFLSKLLEGAKSVVYSSATYAKRPDNMAVYHKTDIGKTGMSVDELTSSIKMGGIPLQQWVASGLAEGGQYTRTELDYSGTNLDIVVDVKNESLHTKQSDDITSILRDIVAFDKEKLAIIKAMDKEAVKEGKRATGEASTAAGVTSSNFSSVIHNIVSQLLLSFRADIAVENAIVAAKEGRKPVITLMNTMESFLVNTVAEGGINIGDPIGFTFKDILKKSLKGTLRYTEISPGGERFHKVFKLNELPETAQNIYRSIENKIDLLKTALPSSPIDYIKAKLEKAGYTVGEITNRKLYVDYSKPTPTLEERTEKERRDRNAIINDFNSGKTKILIFNAAGATGISLHSSEKFATAKEQRELLIVQPQLNIDTFKQAMGRVFRKGQVSKPRFTIIQTALPAEIRPTVILQKKLASLNANTTANKESSAGLKDVPDMMNSYGDSVVVNYLKQNPEINSMLGDPLELESDKDKTTDAMQKVTGKVALLPVQIQRQFYDDIEMAYKELIEHLDQTGENNLHTKDYNFQSKTLEKQITNQGSDESNPFASSTYLEKISVKVLKKPFTKAKIEELVKDSLKGKTAEAFNDDMLAKIKEVTKQYEDTLEGELIEKRKEEIQYDVNLIDYAFGKFKIGHSYSIPIIEDVYTPAVLVDIKHSKTSGNPAAPSKVHLVFAAAPPYQIYKTSLSRKEFISHADSTGEGIPEEWDDLIPKEIRENRYVITGNLLQGFQRLGSKAETINYTTESGETKSGILLPRSTNINDLKEGGTTVGAKEAFEYLKTHSYIESSNKEVTIRVSNVLANISVPKSKADGAKYYLNKPILSVLEVEFSSFGNSMRSHVSIDQLLPLLETLEQETSTRFSIPAKEVKETESQGQESLIETPKEFKPEEGFRRTVIEKIKYKQEMIKRSDIAKFIQEKFDIPIRKGRFGGGALGIFKPKVEVIRTKFAHDIETISHEIGHALHKFLWGSLSPRPFKAYEDELLSIATQPRGGQPKTPEGFAEFIRLYATNNEKALKVAPRFYEYFDALLKEKSPEAREILIETRDRFEKYLTQTPEQRKLSQISINKKGEKKNISLQDILTKFHDELTPLKNVVKEITQGEEIPVIQDPYKLARLMPGVYGKIDAFLEYKPFDFNTYKFSGKSLKEILSQIPKDKIDLYRAYQISKSEYESYQNSLKEGGKPFIADPISIQDAKYMIDKYDTEFGKIFQENVDYRDALLRYFRDANMLSDVTYNKFKKLYKNYVPLYRVMDIEKGAGVGKGLEVYQPIRTRRGSWRDFVDPIESDIKNTYLLISIAEKNAVVNALVDLSNSKQGMGKYVEKIPFPTKKIIIKTEEILSQLSDDPMFSEIIKEFPDISEVVSIFRKSAFTPKENVISVWRKGEQNLYQVHPDIARTIQALDKEEMNTVLKLFSYPARWLRAGAILTPEYFARNPTRDQFPAFIYSEYGFVPGVDLIKGIYAIANKNADYWKFKISGAEHSMLVSLDRTTLQKTVNSLLTDKSLYHDTFKNAIKNPIEFLRILSEYGEMGTRIGEFKKGVKQEGETKAGILESAMSAREISLDYAKKGSIGKIINSLVAFWNANVLDIAKFYQHHARDIKSFPLPPGGHKIPLPTTLKALAAITIPSIVLAIINHDDEEIKQVPGWQKDLFWLIKANGVILRIPKPFLLGLVYGTIPERLVNLILDKDPHAFDNFLHTFARGALPGVIPTTAIPIIENWANKSYFLDRPIVPRNREKVLPEYQYQPYTTELAKQLGKILSKIPYAGETSIASPAKIENLIQGWTGGLGKHALNIADYALRKAGALENKIKPTKTLADMPLIKGFVVRYPSSSAESIQKFYNNYEKLTSTISTARGLAKEFKEKEATGLIEQEQITIKMQTDMNLYYNALGNANEFIHMVYDNPEIKADEKRRLIDNTYLDMINIAKEGNKIFEKAMK